MNEKLFLLNKIGGLFGLLISSPFAVWLIFKKVD